MTHVPVQPLSCERFQRYGQFRDLVSLEGNECIGASPITFYRDMLRIAGPGNGPASASICLVEPRERLVDVLECHDHTDETILPLDGDLLVHFAPATADGRPPMDRLEAFLVPMGTLVVIRPGVWHHAGFCRGDKPVRFLVILPERTYRNDCTVCPVPADEQVRVGEDTAE